MRNNDLTCLCAEYIPRMKKGDQNSPKWTYARFAISRIKSRGGITGVTALSLLVRIERRTARVRHISFVYRTDDQRRA